MSSHPGSTLESAINLAEYLRDINYTPEQVQDFYPTPGTLSTVMYYTGLDPLTMKPVYVPRSMKEKKMQRALLQFKNPRNYDLVHEALTSAGRLDLIGNDKKCLIKEKGDRPQGKPFAYYKKAKAKKNESKSDGNRPKRTRSKNKKSRSRK